MPASSHRTIRGFEDTSRGHLERGAPADMAVLDADPFTIDTGDLPLIRAHATLVGGGIVSPLAVITRYREVVALPTTRD